MADSGWITVVAGVAGAGIAAGSGYLNSRWQSRREREKDSLTVRRNAYVEYLYLAQRHYTSILETVRQLDRLAAEHLGPPRVTSEQLAEVVTQRVEYQRAFSALLLCASPEVEKLAEDRNRAVHAYYVVLNRYSREWHQANWPEVRTELSLAQANVTKVAADDELRKLMKRDLKL